MGINIDLGVPTPPQQPVASFTGTDGTDDEIAATGLIRSLCGWHIAGELTESRVLDSDGGRILPLPTLRLTGVATVAATDTDDDPYAVGSPLDVGALRWSEAGLLSLPTWWPVGFRAVTVTFTHGYDPIPPELAAVTRSIARHVVPTVPAATPLVEVTVAQGDVTRTKRWATPTAAAVEAAGSFSSAERLILGRYALGPLP